MKVERPNVEPGGAQLVAPRPPVKPVGDRQSGRKGAAMHIKDNPISCTIGRRQMAQEQRAPVEVARDPEMLFEGIELANHHDGTFAGKSGLEVAPLCRLVLLNHYGPFRSIAG